MAIRVVIDPVKGLYQEPTSEGASFTVQTGVTTTGISGGGGGVTVIDDGGTITGTYEGDVLCKGNATLAGNVTVQGKLTVLADLINDSGYELTVNGDLLVVQDFLFDHSNPTGVQSNVTIDGNATIKGSAFRFLQGGGEGPATVRIGGNFIGAYGVNGTYIYASGNSNFSGANILVYGDMSGFASVDLFGGPADGIGGNGGAGGNLTVYGNYTGIGYINLYGGTGSPDGVTIGSGGTGGTFDCYGDVNIGPDYYIYLYGGSSIDYPAGVGGGFTCEGNLVANTVDTHGGTVSVLSTGGSGGNGGVINVKGNCVSSLVSYGGNGGGTGAYGGNGGDVNLGGNVNANTVDTHGGQCVDGFAAGNGGSVYANNNLSVGSIDATGGQGQNCYAGGGGAVDVNGIISTNIPEDGLTISTEGGTCTSTSNDHTAGNGGNIYCSALIWPESTIVTSGGSRLGTTTSAGAGTAYGSAGNITVYGDMIVSELYMSGGDVNTEYKSFVGGAGGTLTVEGSLTIQSSAELLGGNARSYDGGVSGRVYVNGGPAICGNLTIQGGASNPASSGGDPSTDRGSVRDSSFRRGINAQSLTFKDGSVGSSPTDAAILQIAGSCNINSLDVENRAEVKVKSTGDLPTVLKLGLLPDKTTLTKGDDTETADISGQLNDRIFHYGADGNWYGSIGFAV